MRSRGMLPPILGISAVLIFVAGLTIGSLLPGQAPEARNGPRSPQPVQKPASAAGLPSPDPVANAEPKPVNITPKPVPVGEVRRFHAEAGGVWAIAFSPDGSQMVSGGDDKLIHLWDVQSGREIRRFEGHTGGVKGLAFSPDGRHILSGSNDKTVRLWDVASGKELTRLDGHTEGVSNVCFSPDGHFAASGSWDHTVRLWDLDRGRQAHALKHGDYVVGVAFSPDGRQLASGSWDRLVRLWDVKTGRELHRFKGHSDRAGDVAFSQDGHYLLSSSTDQTLRLWGVDTGREVSLCQVGADAGWAVAISPDGQRALSVHGADVVLWNLATSQPIRRFQGHTDQVADLAFSPDGRFALSSSRDGSIRLWGLPSESAPTPAEPPLVAHQSERSGATADLSTSAPAQSMALAGNPPAALGGNAAIFLTSPDGQVIPVADGPVSADELRKALVRARECPPDASGGLSARPPVQSSDTKAAAPKPPSPKPRQAPAPPAVAIIPEKSWFALNTEDEAPPSLASVLRLGAPKLCSKDRSLGTALTWAESPSQAFEQAKSEGKLVLLLHVSGNFEDPGFT